MPVVEFDRTDEDRLEVYGQMLRRRDSVVTWGWNIFDLPSNLELATFFSTRNREQMQRFEDDVFLGGQDPKTYINIQLMKESLATVELSKEILEKNTVFHDDKKHGCIHEGEQASTSSGFRNGYHPSMDNKQLAGVDFEAYYKKAIESEAREMEKLKTQKLPGLHKKK